MKKDPTLIKLISIPIISGNIHLKSWSNIKTRDANKSKLCSLSIFNYGFRHYVACMFYFIHHRNTIQLSWLFIYLNELNIDIHFYRYCHENTVIFIFINRRKKKSSVCIWNNNNNIAYRLLVSLINYLLIKVIQTYLLVYCFRILRINWNDLCGRELRKKVLFFFIELQHRNTVCLYSYGLLFLLFAMYIILIRKKIKTLLKQNSSMARTNITKTAMNSYIDFLYI